MLLKREVLITYDLKRMNEVRDLLGASGITTCVKVRNNETAGGYRSRFGSTGTMYYEYKVYVGYKDYKKAMHLLGR